MSSYVNGRVHTNGLENFWSLLKRTVSGTYVAVEPFHLHRYLDEYMFRYNNRATKENPLNDSDRFGILLFVRLREADNLRGIDGQDSGGGLLNARARTEGNAIPLGATKAEERKAP